MKKKMSETQNEPLNCADAIQTVATDFVNQYTADELSSLLGKSPAELKSYLQEVVASSLEYAISILPGRPSRPRKPTV